jgi:hypothetical protein
MSIKEVVDHFWGKYLRGNKPKHVTEDDIVRDILKNIKSDPASLFWFVCIEKEDLIRINAQTGKAIRNRYGIWRKNNPYFRDQMPEEVAHRVMTKVWELLHDQDA